ncbi:HAMP domain-containing histidine kinase [Shewanella sp. D64]|uniref:sensor histidine kinase n=1 Tax=unclassified Shewanella TaxID=196818 RepID=UPI002DD64952|nr:MULTISPECIES: HAMP domain-containing sensor histidine kinase [unclassified Shewanella]MEC4726898.1 HAMP domain-containing histidine kinase [Shewanella sp. D64]MEC4738605.1 HAMP domain-containing histidine kinase [Shewanella sp. E94]
MLLLVLCYTLWARENYFRALDTSFSINMYKAQELINRNGYEAVEPGLEIIDTRLIHDYEDLPKSIRLAYPESAMIAGKHFYATDIDVDTSIQNDYFVYAARYLNNKSYYLLQEYKESETPSYWDIADSQLQQIWIVSIIVTFVLIIFIILGFRYLTKPVYKLNTWSKQLSSDDLNKPIPSFAYRELDMLATQILERLREIDAISQRESQFLQYASHELRTPIAVIKSNAELLEQLIPAKNLPALERIARASNTMQHLTETLLWLTRKEIEQPASSVFQLDTLINELIEEHSYLLKGKNVELRVVLRPIAVSLPHTLVRILIANLIRNAMQHIDEGLILIHLQQQELVITNQGIILEDTTAKQSGRDGFGLGLRLVQQISQQCHWDFTVAVKPECYMANINFAPSPLDKA